MTFKYDYRCGGMPDRSWVWKTLTLPTNQWGQISYNGRHEYRSTGAWYYQYTVINVGLVDRLTPKLFTEQEPLCRFAVIAKLTR